MKRKKLLSTAVAGMLVAAQMVMPVAAANSGTIEVDVNTKLGVLRVVVPTTLAISINQFEIGDAGSQITSGAFTIENQSQLDVKVSVTSTVTAKNDVTFAAKRADVATATGAGGTAWLAVAAKKDATHYQGSASDDDLTKLNETSVNVATFSKGESATTATQTFYLAKGTGNETYKSLKPKTNESNNDVTYAHFYKLTAISTQPTDAAGVANAAKTEDVYVIVTANKDTDAQTVTKIAKGTVEGSITYANTNTYYTAGAAPVAKADLKQADVYVYGAMATVGGKAAFRYIGSLSSNTEKETWESGVGNDIEKITIAYTITGLPASTYTAANTAGDITYGLYAPAPVPYYLSSGGKAYLGVTQSTGFAAEPSLVKVGATPTEISKGTTGNTWSYADGWLTLNTDLTSGQKVEVTVGGVTYKYTKQ